MQYINPEILYTIPASLFSAEPDLLVTGLIPARTIHHIFEGNLLCFPSVRKYSVSRSVVAEVLRQAELAIVVAYEKTHYSIRFERS